MEAFPWHSLPTPPVATMTMRFWYEGVPYRITTHIFEEEVTGLDKDIAVNVLTTRFKLDPELLIMSQVRIFEPKQAF